MKVSPHDKVAKGEQITEYYRELSEDGPVPPDETITHIFKNLIKEDVEVLPYLCDGCPGKGDGMVDFGISGGCYYRTADSFRQTRRYRLEHAEDYSSNEEMASLSSDYLQYFDEGTQDYYDVPGDLDAARLGIDCAERFLRGECTKTLAQILNESEIDQ